MSEWTDAERWARAKEIIPGGNGLLSKRPEILAPDQWPAYYESADGVTVTDVDGNEYIDMTHMAVGAAVLGYADGHVSEAVHEVVDRSPVSSLNPPESVDLAERLLDIHPWADRVKFGRMGGEMMAQAVRIVRASTGNDTMAFCGYHGWHDWYLAANLGEPDRLEAHLLPGLEPAGVPDALEGTIVPFGYNDTDELAAILESEELAAIVMEPVRHEEPTSGFLEGVRDLATDHDVPLVFDEITSGWRMTVGGVHQELGVRPDMAVYGKTLANGYPMAALVGRAGVVDPARESFMSSSFWTERVGPTAALATLDKLEAEDVPAHLVDIGDQIATGWRRLADEHDLPIDVVGLEPLSTFEFDHERDRALGTLFCQEMLKRGYLASERVYVSYAHTEAHVDEYLDAVNDVFGLMADHLADGTVEAALEGPVASETFERLN